MANTFILCNYNMFDKKQTIYLSSKNNSLTELKQVDTLSLGKELYKVCKKNNCDEVRLFGPEDVLNKVINDIFYNNNSKYARENLRVIINKKEINNV